MLSTSIGPWVALLVLGGLHGLNPGMGWLFAVALGLQEGSGRAVWRALPSLAAGHALAVAAAVGLAAALGLVIAPRELRWILGAALLAMGLLQLVRHRHPRYGGMRVGARELVTWSFLMASAHGAGLMALPFLPVEAAADVRGTVAARDGTPSASSTHILVRSSPGLEAAGAGHGAHGGHGGHARAMGHVAIRGGWLALLATLVHAAGYLGVTGAIAGIVYHRVGLRLLRKAWINLDLIWAGALVATALLVLLT